MHYTSRYQSPLGEILLAADNIGLTGLWFYGQKYFALHLDESHEKKTCPVLGQAKIWLDLYFSGQKPDCSVPLHLRGTEFQKEVWEILCDIPYGTTVTYGKIAAVLAKSLGTHVQAVGNAVAHNPVSVIVPCHRVLGSKEVLQDMPRTGTKIKLLELKVPDTEDFLYLITFHFILLRTFFQIFLQDAQCLPAFF